MSVESINDARREAKRRGLDWNEVREAFDYVKAIEWEKREIPNAVRQRAWEFATSVGCHPFWRHGFASRWGKQVADRDHTIVPGYDDIAREVAFHFPQYDHADGTAELFDFLFSPYDRYPTAAELWRKALEYVEQGMGQPALSVASYPEF